MQSSNESIFSRHSRSWSLAFVAAMSAVMHLKGITSPLADLHFWRQCYTAVLALICAGLIQRAAWVFWPASPLGQWGTGGQTPALGVLETALAAALALIEPVILIIMGIVVVFILFSLYLPIFSLGQPTGGPG